MVGCRGGVGVGLTLSRIPLRTKAFGLETVTRSHLNMTVQLSITVCEQNDLVSLLKNKIPRATPPLRRILKPNHFPKTQV